MTQCKEIERMLWTEGADAVPQSHLEECRSCREEARRAADLQAALSGMKNRFAEPPISLEPAIIAAVTRNKLVRAREVVSHPKFRRGAAVGAAAAAAVATAAIGIIAVRRRVTAPDLVA